MMDYRKNDVTGYKSVTDSGWKRMSVYYIEVNQTAADT